jgi:hypothetical protein
MPITQASFADHGRRILWRHSGTLAQASRSLPLAGPLDDPWFGHGNTVLVGHGDPNGAPSLPFPGWAAVATDGLSATMTSLRRSIGGHSRTLAQANALSGE